MFYFVLKNLQYLEEKLQYVARSFGSTTRHQSLPLCDITVFSHIEADCMLYSKSRISPLRTKMLRYILYLDVVYNGEYKYIRKQNIDLNPNNSALILYTDII